MTSRGCSTRSVLKGEDGEVRVGSIGIEIERAREWLYSRSASGYIVTRPGGVLLSRDNAKNSVFASEIGRFGCGPDAGLCIASRGLPAR